MTYTQNRRYGTAIDLSGCQAGKTTDGRCDDLGCLYRTTPEKTPGRPIKVLELLCPRDKVAETINNC